VRVRECWGKAGLPTVSVGVMPLKAGDHVDSAQRAADVLLRDAVGHQALEVADQVVMFLTVAVLLGKRQLRDAGRDVDIGDEARTGLPRAVPGVTGSPRRLRLAASGDDVPGEDLLPMRQRGRGVGSRIGFG
jgi:hypothetical protein